MKKILICLLLVVAPALYALEPAILLLGPPGSGKGTFSDFAQARGYRHLSAGDLIRDEIKKETPFGKEIEEIVKRGDNVDQHKLLLYVQEYMKQFQSEKKPFILDGFGRGERDIQALAEFLVAQNLADSTFVFWLDAPDAICQERIATRLVCAECHHVYNLRLDTVSADQPCLYCNEGVVQIRLNDNEEVTAKRISKYREEYVHHFRRGLKAFPNLYFDTDQGRESCYAFYGDLLDRLASFEGTTSQFLN